MGFVGVINRFFFVVEPQPVNGAAFWACFSDRMAEWLVRPFVPTPTTAVHGALESTLFIRCEID